MRSIVKALLALPVLASLAAAEPRPPNRPVAPSQGQPNAADSKPGDKSSPDPAPPSRIAPAAEKTRPPADRAGGRDIARPNAPVADRPVLKKPMVFYIATGQDACGPGCHEWIAAEGEFDTGAPQRLRKLLARPRATKMPIYFHSPGGLAPPSVTIGRLLREKGMTAGVSRTFPEKCVNLDDNACTALKQTGEVLAAELHSVGTCSSACVFAVIGAKVRQIPPGARLGVHESRITLLRNGVVVSVSDTSETHIPGGITRHRSYVRDMGIDVRLLELAANVPHKSIYFLKRDEIVSLRIDTRPFQETPWLVMHEARPNVTKFLSEAKGPNHSRHRVSMIRLECALDRSGTVYGVPPAPPKYSVSVIYIKGLESEDPDPKPQYKFAFGDQSFLFPKAAKVSTIDALDTGGRFEIRGRIHSAEFLERLESADRIEIAMVDEPGRTLDTIKLSTQGLTRALATMRQKCAEWPVAR